MKIMTEVLKLVDIHPKIASKLAQRLHKKKDELQLIRKSVLSDKADVDKDERSIVSYISTSIKDRDGESLLPDGVVLDNFQKNPVVLYGHDYRSIPIGKSAWVKKDDKGLLAKTIFGNSEFADQIYKAYTEDVGGTGPLLKGWSVGFIPIEWEDVETKDASDPNRIYKKWELLEYSAVPIPSCPEALTLAYQKGLPERLEDDLREDIEELEIIKDEPEPEEDEAVIEIENEEEKETDIVTKPETTDNYHRIPVSEGHVDHEIRTDTISDEQGIKALYCVTCKEIITYLFDVEKWTMEEAQEWVDEHKIFDGKSVVEIDELYQAIDEADIENNEDDLTELIKEIRDELAELKEGRVLSTKNRELVKSTIETLEDTRAALTELYEATEPRRDEGDEEKDKAVEVIKDKEPVITEKQIEAIVSRLVTPETLDAKMTESVQIAVAKLRGKVI